MAHFSHKGFSLGLEFLGSGFKGIAAFNVALLP